MSFDVVLVIAVLSVIAVGTVLAVLGTRPVDEARGKAAVGGVFCLAGACVLSLIGWSSFTDLRALDDRGVTTTAEVTSIGGGKTSRAYVTFTTASGRRVEGSTTNFSRSDVHNGRLEIVYDPQDPTRLQAADWGFEPVEPIFLWVGAAGGLGLGCVLVPRAFGRPLGKRHLPR